MLYYGTEISPNQTESVEGFLICRNVPIARIGKMDYRAADLGLDGDPNRIITVDRYPEDVFEVAAIASFEGKPVTDGHPPDTVDPTNYGMYTKGHAQNVRRDGDYMVADLYINDSILISEIQNGTKREVSCGYMCQWKPDGDGFRQTQIRGNHVAVVPRGRAGHEVSIKDAASSEQPKTKGGETMSEFKKGLLQMFGVAAKDAKPEELEQLTASTLAALDAEPATKAPDVEPAADEMTVKAPKGDDLGSKLDRLIEMVGELAKKNDREEKKLSDESDIDELIEKLEGKEELIDEKGDSKKSKTVPAKSKDACGASLGDAASVELLKALRPAVASIENKDERARVTDALLSAFGSDGQMGSILSAAQDAATRNGQKSEKKTYDQICADQKSAYDALNPHKNKEAR